LPLDDVYIALKDVIPHLTRSNLHRCLQRHGISRLPKADREKPKKFKDYEIGYFHIDIAELRYEGGKGFLFVAVDRTSKLVFARIYRGATKLAAAAFLKVLVKTVPYRVQHRPDRQRRAVRPVGAWSERSLAHPCLRAHLPRARYRAPTDKTLPSLDQWTGRRMVRTIKEATVRSFHYTSINELRRHVRDWLTAYNFAKQLKALRFKTPYEAIEQLWSAKPEIFIVKPSHHMLGLNT
jgi:hypothetical protein